MNIRLREKRETRCSRRDAPLRIPIVHGTDFRAALDKYHKEYEWVEYAAEGHGFNRDENRFDYYRRVDEFLAKYLQAGPVAVKVTTPQSIEPGRNP